MSSLSRLKQILATNLKLEKGPDEIADDTALFGQGLKIDSIDAMEVIAASEKEFGVKFDDEDVKKVREIFLTVKSLADFIDKKLQSK